MNKQQKSGIFFTLMALLIVVILHRPWSGYETEYPTPAIDVAALLLSCQTAGKPDPKLSVAEISRRFADELACVERQRPQASELPLLEWRTQSPLLPWFGSIVHAGGAIAVICALALLWRYLAGQRSPYREETQA